MVNGEIIDFSAPPFAEAFAPMNPGLAGSYSITIWRTTQGEWGARYGIGNPSFSRELIFAAQTAIRSHADEKAKRA